MTARDPVITAPPGRRRWTARVLAVLSVLGPGLIAANAGNDAGGILTYASAGSQFGYRTLYLMVLVTVALVLVQEMCSRLGVYTGEGLGGLIREQFSPRATFVAMTLLLVANAGLTVSEFAGVGAAMEIFGVSRFISVPIAAVFVWALTVLGSYSRAGGRRKSHLRSGCRPEDCRSLRLVQKESAPNAPAGSKRSPSADAHHERRA